MRCAVATGLALVLTAAAGATDPPEAALAGGFALDARPLVKRYCLDCHAADDPEGDVDLTRFADFEDVRRDAEIWRKIAAALDDAAMPPPDAPQPTAEERTRLRSWVGRFLTAEARATAGDPGPVPLRRLSNAEYGYVVRDLVGLDLDPAREFPADGAAGEGFTNAAEALAMSPALVAKYLDAGKEIARHATLTPDGFRFSPATTRRDRTEELVAEIRRLYGRYAADDAGTTVNLQGIKFQTNGGGRLPVERYLTALLAEREPLVTGRTTTEAVAAARGLSPRYLALLRGVLEDETPSPVFDGLRRKYLAATPADAAALTADIAARQAALSRFQNVGHMKPWVVAVDPLTNRREFRLKIPAAATGDVLISLAAGDAGDGAAGDVVIWERPRLVMAGRPDLPLRDVRSFMRVLAARRETLFAATAAALAAADEADRSGSIDAAELARRHGVDANVLTAWLDLLGLGTDASASLDRFTNRLSNVAGHDFISGWGVEQTPSILANSSDTHVRIPGNMQPHGVAVHPSPTQQSAVGWRCPTAGTVRIDGSVTHAHPECGNGVAWSLEWRRGGLRRRLAAGTSNGAAAVVVGPVDAVAVRPGDLISLLVGPRDGNHSCDLTAVDLVIRGGDREWNLAADVSGDITAANPHPDRLGHADVWHFYTEPIAAGTAGPAIPGGSLLARWQSAESTEARGRLAGELQTLLTSDPPPDADHPDAVLYRQLASLGGPLLASVRPAEAPSADTAQSATVGPGLDPQRFGRAPDGRELDPLSLCVRAPATVRIRLPAELVAGSEFVTAATLRPDAAGEGSVQANAVLGETEIAPGLAADLPVIVNERTSARARFAEEFETFRRVFPAALCYPKIVPVDEAITLTLFHREDEPLVRLMLSDDERTRLDRLWEELHFVSRDALTVVDAFAQLLEYASQDADPSVFEPLRKPIDDRAAAFRQALLDAEPRQIDALVEFAARAYRRPAGDADAERLRPLYRRLRDEGLSHEEAFRLSLAAVFTSPAFLYRLEAAPEGPAAAPVSDAELAARLSFFLWSSLPDAELSEVAAAGRLHDPDALAAQARRMLADDRTRRLATEFACQWLQVYDFAALDGKNERLYPEFAGLRADMAEEPTRFFADLFRRDGSALEILDADHVFVNGPLATHYGIPDVEGPEWRRIDGARAFGRGGALGFAATLAKQSGASRTSPTLRGNWVSEVLLGERLPRPPKDVPPLPDEIATAGLSVRQLVERHAADARCAVCHVRIDPLGFSLERFDAIGRRREAELDGSPVDDLAALRDGTRFAGLDGLRDHLTHARREAFLRQFCKKLLGYALGRGVRLSDEPLLGEMRTRLAENRYRVSVAVDAIVCSRQFREIRGRDAE